MSVVTFGAQVNTFVLDVTQQNKVRTAQPRDAGDVFTFLSTVSAHPQFAKIPKHGETVEGWTASVRDDGLDLGDVTWSRSGAHDAVRVGITPNGEDQFFTPHPFMSTMYPGVKYFMDPESIGNGAAGTVYRVTTEDPADAKGNPVRHPSFVIKVMFAPDDAQQEVDNVKLMGRKSSEAFADSIPAVVLMENVRLIPSMNVWMVAMEEADGDLFTFEEMQLGDEVKAVHLAFAVFQEVQHMHRVTGLIQPDVKPENFLYRLSGASKDSFTVSMADYGSLGEVGESMNTTTFASPRTVAAVTKHGLKNTWAHVALGIAMLIPIFMNAQFDHRFTLGKPEGPANRKVQSWMGAHPGPVGKLVADLLQYDFTANRMLPTQDTDGAIPRITTAEDIQEIFAKYFGAPSSMDLRNPYPNVQ